MPRLGLWQSDELSMEWLGGFDLGNIAARQMAMPARMCAVVLESCDDDEQSLSRDPLGVQGVDAPVMASGQDDRGAARKREVARPHLAPVASHNFPGAPLGDRLWDADELPRFHDLLRLTF
jgi:hypothetical protein